MFPNDQQIISHIDLSHHMLIATKLLNLISRNLVQLHQFYHLVNLNLK